jgi:P-type conjugative transfer protein TrbG
MMGWVTASAVRSGRRWMRSMERFGIICVAMAIGVPARGAGAQATLPVQRGQKGAGPSSCDSSVDSRRDRWDTLRDTTGDGERMACGTAGRLSGRDSVGTAEGSRTLTDPVVAAAREYAKTGVARTVEQGAFEIFPYGHAQPTVTCAPLRACVIELEAGESVLSKIAGDTQRWEIQLAVAGTNGQTPLVVVKPHDCGLTTNLVLATTAGRIYDLTLDSPPCPHSGLNPHGAYVRHVRFYYPDALVESWAAPQAAPATVSPATANLSALNFAYRIAPERHVAWVPIAVFDDGAHCYIKLPPGASHREAPALFALADDGRRILLNYNLVGDGYVTDRVFRSAVLVVGEGGHERTVRLDNMRYDAGISADAPVSGDPTVTPQGRIR